MISLGKVAIIISAKYVITAKFIIKIRRKKKMIENMLIFACNLAIEFNINRFLGNSHELLEPISNYHVIYFASIFAL